MLGVCIETVTPSLLSACLLRAQWGAGIAQWLDRLTRDRKSRVRVPAGSASEFSAPRSTFCADSFFGVRSTPVIPQWHVKDPGHSAKSAGGRLLPNAHAPYICGFEGGDTKLVHGLKRPISSSVTRHQPINSQIALSVHYVGEY